MSKRTNGIPAILIIIFLFSSITVLQQGVLGLQPNQTSSKNMTSQATPQGTSLGSNKSSAVSNATGFTNAANLTVKDKIFPIKYNITGGKLIGLLPDKDKTTVVAVLSPVERRT
jgi:hypothetical protein